MQKERVLHDKKDNKEEINNIFLIFARLKLHKQKVRLDIVIMKSLEHRCEKRLFQT